MKKLFVLFFLVLLSAITVSAQELLVQGGGGLSKYKDVSTGNYGFAQARLMFGQGLRVGPYVGYTQYGMNQLYIKPNPAITGNELSAGISVDFYKPLSYSYNTYFWVNTGFKNSTDKYKDEALRTKQTTNGVFVSGGWFVTDEWSGWFGNNRLMFDYFKPFKSTITGTQNGNTISNFTTYNKESVRLVLESGIKRFGKNDGVQLEPLIHLGYGHDAGRSRSYTEIGGGIDLGLMKIWYRDILKVKAFWRQDTKYEWTPFKSNGAMVYELVFDATSFVKAIKK